MYTDYFGLKREPFSIAPDPRYLFMSERHREALAHLLYGVQAGGGGRPVTVVMNIRTPDVQGFQRSQSQIAAQAARAD